MDAYRVVAGRMPATGSPVIDVGSGLGTFVLLSRSLGLPAVGIEPGEEELALARERARDWTCRRTSSERERASAFLSRMGQRAPC